MAKPRIFISSTYFDLRSVRADLERFMTELGYEPVLHERGQVAYGNEEPLEDYCYREIEVCDVLVAIIGSRFGANSHREPYSITQQEIKKALDIGTPVYVFVDRYVLAEYRTYLQNKTVKDFKPAAADDLRIYHFLEEVMLLPKNNPIAPFETAEDITRFLREQWSGLFQRLLEEHARQREVNLVKNMENTLNTLNQLVTFLTEEKQKGSAAIQDILLFNHPIFDQLRKLLFVPYRVLFLNKDELAKWLGIRGYKPVSTEQWENKDIPEWFNEKSRRILKISNEVFGPDGSLKIFTPQQWKPEFVRTVKLPAVKEQESISSAGNPQSATKEVLPQRTEPSSSI